MEKRKNRHEEKSRDSAISELVSDDIKKMFSSEFGTAFEHDIKSESDHKRQHQTNRNNDKGRFNVSNHNNNNQVDFTHDIELPDAARNFFKDTNNENIKAVDNLYLLHQRFSGKFYYRKKNKVSKDYESFLKFIYTDSLEYVEAMIQEARQNRKPLPKPEQLLAFYYKNSAVYKKGKKLCVDLCKALSTRTKEIAESHGKNALTKDCLEFKPAKLIVGIGGGTPYGSLLLMSFHHLYGLPYLPATAIKGMLRGYWEQEILINEEAAEKDKVIKQLFGGEEKSGDLIFFDIFPQEFEIDFDVMAPHYGDYYGKDQPPTDDKAPVPIIFPYVKDATFNLYVAYQRDEFIEKCYKDDNDSEDSKCWQKILKKLCKSEKEFTLQDIVTATLTDALQLYGIGAKTALGYGLGR